MTEDLPSLIEQHQKEIWEWKQKESQWIMDKNQLDGHKRIVEEISTKMVEMGNKIRELESTLASAQAINDTHQKLNGKLQTRLTEVEEDNKKLAIQIQDLNNRKP